MAINTFGEQDAGRILQIPLARTIHDDMQIWYGEPSGEFTVRSTYKLLQSLESDPMAYALQETDKNFLQIHLEFKFAIENEDYIVENFMEFNSYLSQSTTMKAGYCDSLPEIWFGGKVNGSFVLFLLCIN